MKLFEYDQSFSFSVYQVQLKWFMSTLPRFGLSMCLLEREEKEGERERESVCLCVCVLERER